MTSLDEIFGIGTESKLKKRELDESTLAKIRLAQNPEKKEVGHYTGRCLYCHSKDLWDDASLYGCNVCDAMYTVGDMLPKIAMNRGVPEPPEVTRYNQIIDEEMRQRGLKINP